MFRRDYAEPGYVLETVRPLEVPVIAQVKHLLAEDHYVQAVTLAYQTALVDLQRTYRFQIPAHWTHKDVLQWAARSNLGLVSDLLARLYRLYEAVRYGTSADIVRGDVLGPLTSLYAQTPLWRAYPFRGYDRGLGYGMDDGSGGGSGLRALPP